MKQCPNPNCILYTRLDELPDAYRKCPGCGGLLVSSELSSQMLSSGHLPRRSGSAAPLTYSDDETLTHSTPLSGQLPDDEEDEYAYPTPYGYEATEDGYNQDYDPSYALPPETRPGTRSKLGFVAGGLVLLVVCGGLAFLLGSRFLPQTRTLSAPQATETALSWLRPPVNTPITILPTVAVSGAAPVMPLASATPYMPQANPPANPTPQPPVQPQTQASTPGLPVGDTRMSVRFERGEPVGEVSAYGRTDPFNLAVRANYGPGGITSVLTRWYGPDGVLIYDLRKEYPQAGTYYGGFTLRKDSPWLPGNYRVDVHTNDSPAPVASVSFTVVP